MQDKLKTTTNSSHQPKSSGRVTPAANKPVEPRDSQGDSASARKRLFKVKDIESRERTPSKPASSAEAKASDLTSAVALKNGKAAKTNMAKASSSKVSNKSPPK